MAEVGRHANVMERSATRRRRLITTTMVMTCTLFGIDQSMISVALPTIRGSLSLQNDQLSWIASSYVLAFMAISPGVRWLCFRFGRREVFCASLAIMAAANAFCASITSIQMLVALRIVQGATMGVVFPLTLSNLLDEYPGDRHPQTIALWTTAGWIGPIIGAALAGILVYRHGWPAIFVFQAVACAILVVGSFTWTRRKEQQSKQKLDVIGLITIVLAIVSFQLLLMRGLDNVGEASSGILLGICVVCGLIFSWNLRRSAHSIVNPKLFGDRNFTFSATMLILLGFEIFSISFIIPLVLADVIRADAFQISMLTLPRLIGTAFGAAIAGGLNRALGSESLAAGSFALIGLGSFLMLAAVETAEPVFVIVGGALIGVGVGVASTALGTLAFATLPVEWRDEGAALRQLLRIVGGTLGISILVVITNGSASTGASNYFGGFIATAIVGFLAFSIVLLRLLVGRDRRRPPEAGATPLLGARRNTK
jgi:DHA2 family multidrug resistance protein